MSNLTRIPGHDSTYKEGLDQHPFLTELIHALVVDLNTESTAGEVNAVESGTLTRIVSHHLGFRLSEPISDPDSPSETIDRETIALDNVLIPRKKNDSDDEARVGRDGNDFIAFTYVGTCVNPQELDRSTSARLTQLYEETAPSSEQAPEITGLQVTMTVELSADLTEHLDLKSPIRADFDLADHERMLRLLSALPETSQTRLVPLDQGPWPERVHNRGAIFSEWDLGQHLIRSTNEDSNARAKLTLLCEFFSPATADQAQAYRYKQRERRLGVIRSNQGETS